MKEEQLRLKKEKQNIRRELKNAEAKRSRLKKKARQLTDEDLVHVMMWRKEVKDRRLTEEHSTEGDTRSTAASSGQGAENEAACDNPHVHVHDHLVLAGTLSGG